MADKLISVLIGMMIALMFTDYACQSVTNDRCTFGVPNPVTETPNAD